MHTWIDTRVLVVERPSSIEILFSVEKALAHRWNTVEGQKLGQEVVARLVLGQPLDKLPLGRHEGRIDLRGLSLPAQRPLRRVTSRVGAQSLSAVELEGVLVLRGVILEGLDLSGSRLKALSLFDSKIARCRFDG